MHTVYYLVHYLSGRRIGYYQTRRGARIAMRLRNLHLGWRDVLERTQQEPRELELCLDSEGNPHVATYCIEEDVVDTPDLIDASDLP